MSKKQRHNDIIKLIEEREIETQEMLTEALIKLGYKVSQSTVSRDINQLNLLKVEGENKKSYYIKAIDTSQQVSKQKISIIEQSILSVEYANNLIVIKTLSGHANAVALIVDEMNFPQVLGSIAGDDTVLIIAKTINDAEIVTKSLRNYKC